MKRGREEKNSHETLPSPTRRCHDGVIYIPLDLTVEILKKLPTKTLMRSQCVSKQWSSLISCRRDLRDSILTRSLNQPPRDAHIISDDSFIKSIIAFSSTTSPLNTDNGLVLVPGQYHQYVRGLVCCWSKYFRPNVLAVYNPTTRQSFDLPELKSKQIRGFFFGYDPCKDQYKVLSMPGSNWGESCQVFTLGDPTAKQWRTIQPVMRPQFMLLPGDVCINGIIYYRDANINFDYHFPENIKLMSFDVSSEKFNHVEASKLLMHMHRDSTLINYQEKLALTSCEISGLEILVMETQGWSKFFVCEMTGFEHWIISGTTRGGEIVFVEKRYSSHTMLRVYYYDLKRNSMRHVDLKTEIGSRKRYMSTILTVPDHVDNIMGLHYKTE
ncbi:PREDICTED: probable F-box protein At3g56670 [Camelina sativa]|uniref:Probable F-box protein At3g56670 n=1 Tax=Camelina sativa TaxID=90675 RepID=A0ABM0YWT9_CAMSA|nr:PREDICTED: probable F-box protein At3g56670 [Camelina sativa]